MSAARAWFAGRSLREKRLILVMLALLALTLVWAAVVRPVSDGLASARARHADAVVRVGEIEAQLAALRRAQRAVAAPLLVPLGDAVRARADAAGFSLTSLEPDGAGGVRAAVPTARAGALLGWIAGLEAEGVLVEDVSITGNGDGTVAARMTLRARAA